MLRESTSDSSSRLRNEGDKSADGRRSAPLDSPDDDDLTDPFQLERAVWTLLLPADDDVGEAGRAVRLQGLGTNGEVVAGERG